MTSLSLVLWIVFGIGVQLVLFFGITFWRHWQNFEAMKKRAGDAESSAAVQWPAVDPIDGGSRLGFHAFKVTRKLVEDGVGSICSFYLEPEDRQALPSFLPGQF
ncbi:MAG: hypothetical protein ACR2I0_11280, partial [Rhodoferax sp.]